LAARVVGGAPRSESSAVAIPETATSTSGVEIARGCSLVLCTDGFEGRLIEVSRSPWLSASVVSGWLAVSASSGWLSVSVSSGWLYVISSGWLSVSVYIFLVGCVSVSSGWLYVLSSGWLYVPASSGWLSMSASSGLPNLLFAQIWTGVPLNPAPVWDVVCHCPDVAVPLLPSGASLAGPRSVKNTFLSRCRLGQLAQVCIASGGLVCRAVLFVVTWTCHNSVLRA
jgi:hypothetical protein